MSQEAPGCLGAILRLFGIEVSSGREEGVRVDAYQLRDDFLSPAEATFFRVLRVVAGERFVISPKVRLADIFYVSRPHENRGALNRITSKHVDFLLLDPLTLKPAVGIELDDSTHQQGKSVTTDEFKNRLFAAAGLPLVRVPVQRAYEVQQVSTLLSAAIGNGEVARGREEPLAVPNGSEAPVCPKCGIPMRLRTAKRGENQGGEFWGCVNYPSCRAVVPKARA